ncbi:unnamed protein product [Malus baccata var. baccata]
MDHKIEKATLFRQEKLKRSLYCLFSQYGRILDVVASKTPRLRGQAWVAFLEVASASNAVRQMQNFPFYDKPMRIQYAKTKSDCIAEAEGTLAPKEKKRKQEDKGHRNTLLPLEPLEPIGYVRTNTERKRRGDEGQQPATENGAAAENGGRTAPSRHGNSNAQEAAAPNNILFIENLPHETTSDMLELLFKQFAGFREVRMIDAKPGIAFVEYEDDIQSSIAMQALQGFKVTPQNAVAITFAKK